MDRRAAFAALLLSLLTGCHVHTHAAPPPPPPPPPAHGVHGHSGHDHSGQDHSGHGQARRVPAQPNAGRSPRGHRAAEPSRGRAGHRGESKGRRGSPDDGRLYREDMSEERWQRLKRYDTNGDGILDVNEQRRARKDRRQRRRSRTRD